MMVPTAPVQSVALANGIPLRLQVLPGRQTVALALWWCAGRADEEAGEIGAAHLLEHLVCEAVDRDVLARAGGLFNGQSGREWTVWHALVPTDAAPEMLRALVQALLAPLPGAAHIAQEARVTGPEIHAAAAADAWESLALLARFGEHPLCRSLAVLPEIERAGLDRFRARLLLGSRLMITAAGAVDADALRAAADALASLPAGIPPVHGFPLPPDRPVCGRLPREAGAGALWLLPFAARMNDAVGALADLLAHPLLGRLPRALRSGPHVVYALDSRLEWVGGMGLWWLRIDDARAAPLLEAEIDRALAGGWSDAELTRARALRRARQAIETEDPVAQLERLAGLRPEARAAWPTAGEMRAALVACWGRRCRMTADERAAS